MSAVGFDNLGKSSAIYGQGFDLDLKSGDKIRQNLETSIKNLKEKLERKTNTGFNRYGIYNRFANIIPGRKRGMSGILNKIKNFYKENGSDFNENLLDVKLDLDSSELKGIKHSSVYKDVMDVKLKLEKAKLQNATKMGLGERLTAVNELRDLMYDAYWVLEIATRNCKSCALDSDGEMAFKAIDDKDNKKSALKKDFSLDGFFVLHGEIKHSNVKVKGGYLYKGKTLSKKEVCEKLQEISERFEKCGLPALEIKNGTIEHFDEWYEDCVKGLCFLLDQEVYEKNNDDVEKRLEEDEKRAMKTLPQSVAEELYSAVGESKVGEGTFGVLHKVLGSDGKWYAVKKLKSEELKVDKIERELICNEYFAKGIKKFSQSKDALHCEGVRFGTEYMGFYGVGEGDKREYFYVFELNKGENLDKFINSGEENSKAVLENTENVLDIGIQMFHGVEEMHGTGVVNRDIKPDNMMICFEEEKIMVGEEEVTRMVPKVKLIDLGEGYFLGERMVDSNGKRSFSADDGERCTKGVGSPSYMAPEVLNHDGNINGQPAVDVFACGIGFLEVLFGGQLYSKRKFRFPWQIAEKVVKIDYGKLLKEDDPFKSFEKELGVGCSRVNDLIPNKAHQEFFANILADCLCNDPKERITAGQAAELLQIFASMVKNDAEGDYKAKEVYKATKALVIEDRPREIPPGVMNQIFSGNYQEYIDGMNAVEYLVSGNSSYKATTSYGLLQLCFGTKEEFGTWKSSNSEVCKRMIENLLIDGRFDQLTQDKQGILKETKEYKDALLLAIEKAPDYDDDQSLSANLISKFENYIRDNSAGTDDILQKLDEVLSRRIRAEVRAKEITVRNEDAAPGNKESKLLTHVKRLGDRVPEFKNTVSYGLALLAERKVEVFKKWGREHGDLLNLMQDNTLLKEEDSELVRNLIHEIDAQKTGGANDQASHGVDNDSADESVYGIDTPVIEHSFDTDDE